MSLLDGHRPLTRIQSSVLMESDSGQKSPGVQSQNHSFLKHGRSKASGECLLGKLYPEAGKAPPLRVIRADDTIQV